MKKTSNIPFKVKSLALSLMVGSLAACSGGAKTDSSSSDDTGVTSSIASSDVSSVASSAVAQSSAPSSIMPPSSAAQSSMGTASSISYSSMAQVPGNPHASVSGTFPDDVALAPAQIQFKSDQSWDEDGMITNVKWDFGDGNTSTEFNPRHTYSTVGTYNVSLTVTDNDGLTNTTWVPITVISEVGNGVAPTAAINASQTRGQVPLAVTLDASDSGVASGAKIVSYKWDFPDQTSAYGPVINKTFNDAHTHKVYLTVTDDQGLSSESSIEIQGILNVPKGVPGVALQTQGNPFTDSAFYVSPDIETLQNQSLEKVDAGAQPELFNDMKFVQQMPSAVWLDRTLAIYGGEANNGRRPLSKFYLNAADPYQGLGHFDEAVEQQKALAAADGTLPPMTVVIIVYNLPDRDCAALASNGLLNETNDGDGDGLPDMTGMAAYKEKYIDVIADVFARYDSLRIVAMLEPDGYPNMITNVGKMFPQCDAVSEAKVYEKALQYAISKLAPLDNVYTYLDIGHSGWLGWPDNMSGAISGFTRLVEGAGGLNTIKGFASNTSGYTPLREPYISNKFADRMALAGFYEWNQQVDELSFIDTLYEKFTAAGFGDNLGFIIDTARNGWGGPNRPTGEGAPASKTDASHRIDLRIHRGHWCNVDEAGIGEIPQADPDPARPYLDAYYWMKPPGESDGISDKDAVDANEEGKSYDPMCGGESSNSTGVTANVLQGAPHAGSWFHDQFVMLIENAYPPLGTKEPAANAGGAKPSVIESFDNYSAGNAPGGNWDVQKTSTTTVQVTADKFTGLQGHSVYLASPTEPESNDETAMLGLAGNDLGAAAGNLFGRARLFVEDNGPDTDMKWTFVTAQGKLDQIGDVKYRLGSVEGKFALSTDSNSRGSTCELISATPIPKDAWACVEWQLNPAGQLNVWLNGEQIQDLMVTSNSPGCSNEDWGAGPSSFDELAIGIGRFKPTGQQPQRPQNEPEPPAKPPVSLYMDDVALSEGRLGCGKVRP